MFRFDNSTASASRPTFPSPGTEGFPTDGTPGVTPATIVPAWWVHMLTEEMRNVVIASGISPVKNAVIQVVQSIRRMAGAKAGALTANTTLTADDAGFIAFNASAGNRTLTLPAANAAAGTIDDGSGSPPATVVPIRYTIQRTDTVTGNTLTIARAGSDAIGGGTAYLVDCGETVMIASNGVDAWSIVSTTKRGAILYNVKTAGSTTFTVPAGVYRIRVRVWGAGGGGGGAGVGVGAGGGGGSGGYAEGIFPVIPGATYTVVVGAGGSSGSSGSGTSGGSGGNTSVSGTGISIQATGGGGGALANPSFAGGLPGTGSNGSINLVGSDGTDGWSNYQSVGGAGGNAPIWGGGGRAGSGGGVGGRAPGAGGGACYGTAGGGGAGADGMVIIEAG